MRFTRKFGVGLVATCAIGGALVTYQRQTASSAPRVKELSSDEFNALFDGKQIQKILTDVKRTTQLRPAPPSELPTLRLYRLLGCPFCARVKMILDFCRIPYEEVMIDPLNGTGLKDPRYPYAPQLELVAAGSQDGLFTVNSSDIVKLLATVYQFEGELSKPNIIATRAWIGDRFQGVTFAVLAQSWWSAYYGYPALVPERYHNKVFQVIGATALYGLSRFKITPKLKAQVQGTDKQQQTEAEAKKIQEESAEAWLLREAAPFSKHLTGSSQYHGGKVPDVADVEMFAVMSTVVAHPLLGKSLQSNHSEEPLMKWFREMRLREVSETPWAYK